MRLGWLASEPQGSTCLSLPSSEHGEHKGKLPCLAFCVGRGARGGLHEWVIGLLPIGPQSQPLLKVLKEWFHHEISKETFVNSKSTNICLCYYLEMSCTPFLFPSTSQQPWKHICKERGAAMAGRSIAKQRTGRVTGYIIFIDLKTCTSL